VGHAFERGGDVGHAAHLGHRGAAAQRPGVAQEALEFRWAAGSPGHEAVEMLDVLGGFEREEIQEAAAHLRCKVRRLGGNVYLGRRGRWCAN
jgi:hypothetical protein